MARITLPNGCSFTPPTVNPADWKSRSISLKKDWHRKDWYISYRFYDPLFKKEYPNGKLVSVRGMNGYKEYETRKEATENIIEDELYKLRVRGYNPITKQALNAEGIDYEIEPEMPWLDALEAARRKTVCSDVMKVNIKSALKYISIAGAELRLHTLPISKISLRHLRRVFSHLTDTRETFGTPSYNHYRTYLIKLWKTLCQMETVETNPAQMMEKIPETVTIKETLTMEERQVVNEHLKSVDFPFWRFLHIFFHSGARITELLKLQVKDVDLAKQRYKIIVRKGQQSREVWKTIKDIALPLWQDQLTGAGEDDFVFSLGLLPGSRQVWPQLPTRRWKKLIKDNKDLKTATGDTITIAADFYSLKHLNSTEVTDLLSAEDAAKSNSHTSSAMVVKIYDVKREERQHERLRKVNNSFV